MNSVREDLIELKQKVHDCELKAAELRLKAGDYYRAAKEFEERAEGFRREWERKVNENYSR